MSTFEPVTIIVNPTFEVISKYSQNFWAFNFWGILGAVSGVAGLIISYLTFRYNRPHIRVEAVCLNFSKHFLDKTTSSPEDFKSSFVDFILIINIDNTRGGPGSIEKPKLIIKEKRKQNIICLLAPTTKKFKHKRISSMVSESEVINLGNAFYLRGGEKLPGEEIYYSAYDSDIIYALVKDKFDFKFYIGYSDNFGKYFESEIRTIQPVDHLYQW